MDSSVSRKDKIWFLSVCHHVSNVLYSFLLEAESTPGPQCDWKDYVNEKSTDTSWDYNSTSGPRRKDERGVKGVSVLAVVGTTMSKRVP